jgi:glycosyltransferase involved in cell wall biosynthesis
MKNRRKPLVSVIMPAYNASSTIDSAIRSILNQTYKDWELIVIDDGSTDNTADLIQSFNHPGILLIKQENQGQSGARNTGIDSSKGEYIAFLDADDLWEEDKLREQIDCFKKAKHELGFVHTGYREFDDKKEYKPKPLRFVRKKQLKGFVFDDLVIHNFVGVLTVMIPRKILDEVGVFDKSLINSPDWDLWLRITRKYPVDYVDKSLARYRLNPHGLSKNYESYEKNLWMLLERHLLTEELPEGRRKRGLWLYYRHMTHGFARNGNFKKSFENLRKTCKTRPLTFLNILSFLYILYQISQSKRQRAN